MWVTPAAMPSPPWPGVAQPLGFPASTSLQSQAPVWGHGGRWGQLDGVRWQRRGGPESNRVAASGCRAPMPGLFSLTPDLRWLSKARAGSPTSG